MHTECHHQPSCPAATASDRSAARVVRGHPEQGWSLLCNGVILFEDGGYLLPRCDAFNVGAQAQAA